MDEITWTVPLPGEDREYEILPEDSYPATLWAVKTVDKPDWMQAADRLKPEYEADEYDTQQWEWIFEVQDPEYQGQRLSAYINRSLHAKSNGFRFMVPLLGRVPEPGETIGFSQFVGRPCKITVKIKDKKDGNKYNKITDVLAPRGPRTQVPRLVPDPEEFGADITPAISNGVTATDKQIKAIYAIGRSVQRLAESQVDDRCIEVFGVAPAELTKSEASQLIDMFKGPAVQPEAADTDLWQGEEGYPAVQPAEPPTPVRHKAGAK